MLFHNRDCRFRKGKVDNIPCGLVLGFPNILIVILGLRQNILAGICGVQKTRVGIHGIATSRARIFGVAKNLNAMSGFCENPCWNLEILVEN